MSGLALAFSVHKFVTSVGADVGFAALIGLAVLVLLFFAQARETAGLRARAEELLGRVAELEARLARVHAESVAAPAVLPPPRMVPPQPTAAPASVVAPGWATQPLSQATEAMPVLAGEELAALELAPFPPAGVGAPALSAATRVVPAGVPVRAAANRPAPAPAPMTAAALTNGTTRVAPVPVAERPAPPPRPAPAPARAPGAAGPRPGERRPPPRPSLSGGDRTAGRHTPWSRVGVVALTVLVVAAAAAAAAIALTNGSGSKKPSASPTTAARTPSRSTKSHTRAASTVTVNPSTVTVAVLNGTGAAHVAARVSERLVAQGFRPGRVTDAADMTQSATVVAYTAGNRNQALAVAQALKLAAGAVQPIDQSTLLVACGGASGCGTSVVVTVGANLASQ